MDSKICIYICMKTNISIKIFNLLDKSIHIREDNLLCSVYLFKCNFI